MGSPGQGEVGEEPGGVSGLSHQDCEQSSHGDDQRLYQYRICIIMYNVYHCINVSCVHMIVYSVVSCNIRVFKSLCNYYYHCSLLKRKSRSQLICKGKLSQSQSRKGKQNISHCP